MLKDKQKFFLRLYAPAASLAVFLVYLLTIAPSVVQIDSGELAAVQSTLGIAHPTGYPLFTIIGYLFLLIPLPLTKIFQANLLAAAWCALGILLFIKSALIIYRNSGRNPLKTGRKTSQRLQSTKIAVDIKPENSSAVLSIIAGGFALAFSETFWLQSTSVEVYSLQIFLFMLNIYLTLRVYYSEKNSLLGWILVAVSLAFGFANHMTTILILPFLGIIFFDKEKFGPGALRTILYMLLAFIPLLLLLYMYLPLRASADVPINWGNPVNAENFLRHVSGKQYQVWMFASVDAAKSHLIKFLTGFPSEFGYSGLLLGLIGIIPSFRKYRIIFYALTGSSLFSVFYSINYDIADLDSYFLLAYIMFSFFIVSGFYTTAEYLNHKYNSRVSLISLLLLSAFPPAINFGRVDQSNVHSYQDYSRAILNSTEKNSIIFSYQWDFFVSPSYYFQKVENFRNDVAVIDKELLRRSWYYDQIRRNHPGLFRNMESDIANFLTALSPFERGEDFESGTIEKYYRILMTKLISSNIGEHNFYIGQELFQNEMQRGEFSLPEGYNIVPHLLLFKVVKGNEYVPVANPDFTIRFPSVRNKYLDSIETFIYNMLIYRAYYELQFNKPDRAKLFVEKIVKEFPGRIIPAEILSRIEK